MTPLEWSMGRHTGISSLTIMHVMEDTPTIDVGVPRDPADFGRCHRLLQAFPGYRKRMHEVADKYPRWIGLVREWDNLTAMFEAHQNDLLYDTMAVLIDEGLAADGWVRTKPGIWIKGQHPNAQRESA